MWEDKECEKGVIYDEDDDENDGFEIDEDDADDDEAWDIDDEAEDHSDMYVSKLDKIDEVLFVQEKLFEL